MTRALGGKAFFSLLARPAVIWFGMAWLFPTMLLAEYGRRVHSLVFLCLLTPLPAGVIAGQLIAELQHASFAWTLPRVRVSLAGPLVGISVFWAWFVLWLPGHSHSGLGPVPSAGVAGLAAFGFLGFWWGLCVLDPIHRWKTPVASAAAIGLGVLAHSMLRNGGTIALPVMVATAGVTGWCAYLTLSRDVLRRRPERPTLTMANSHLPSVVEQYRAERLATRARRGRDWARSLVDAPVLDWMRAAFFERQVPGSRLVLRVVISYVLLHSLCLTQPSRLWSGHVAADIVQVLVVPVTSGHFVLALVVVFTLSLVFGVQQTLPVGLVPELSHPLRRSFQARVTWLSHWAVAGGAVVLAATILGTEAWIAARVAGAHAPAGRLPGLVPALAFAASLLPFGLWFSTKADWRKARSSTPAMYAVASFVSAVAAITATTIVSVLSADPPSGASPVVQLVFWMAWLTFAFLLHRRLVTRYFDEGDLI